MPQRAHLVLAARARATPHPRKAVPPKMAVLCWRKGSTPLGWRRSRRRRAVVGSGSLLLLVCAAGLLSSRSGIVLSSCASGGQPGHDASRPPCPCASDRNGNCADEQPASASARLRASRARRGIPAPQPHSPPVSPPSPSPLHPPPTSPPPARVWSGGWTEGYGELRRTPKSSRFHPESINQHLRFDPPHPPPPSPSPPPSEPKRPRTATPAVPLRGLPLLALPRVTGTVGREQWRGNGLRAEERPQSQQQVVWTSMLAARGAVVAVLALSAMAALHAMRRWRGVSADIEMSML